MSNLPPIGSLWLHRESGERRRVENTNDMPSDEYVCFRRPHSIDILKRLGYTWASLSDWLSWAAHADRIDKEEA